MLFPADCQEWDDAVCAAYPLKKYIIENNNVIIKLFSPDKRPTFFTNAPYLEEGGIMFKNKSDNDLGKEVFNLFNEFNLNYILFKSRENLSFKCNISHDTDDAYYTFLLDTTLSLDEIWKNKLKAQTRNKIRKSEKKGFHIRFGHVNLLDDFYTVISNCWRDLGTPIHSYQFFRLLLKKFNKRVCIAVLFDNNKPIATALLFNINGVLSHPFAGTINSYKPTAANNLLYWNIIKYACENKIYTLDMGRTRLGQGTYNFKKSWGGERRCIHYYYFLKEGVSRPSYNRLYYRAATTVWKFMPLKIANWFGPKLIYKII